MVRCGDSGSVKRPQSETIHSASDGNDSLGTDSSEYGGQVKSNGAYTKFVCHGPDSRQCGGSGERVLPARPAAEHSHLFGWDWTQGTAIPPHRMSSCLLAIASSAAGKSLHKTVGHPRGRWRGIACMVCGPHKTRTQSGGLAAKACQGKASSLG